MRTRSTMSALLTLLLLSGAVLATAGCAEHHREGPAERAGKKVDRAADKAGDAAEDTGRKINRALPGN